MDAACTGTRKGIFFTLSVLLLGISLLSFTYFFAEQSAKSKGTAVSLLQIDRTSDTYANMEAQIVRVLSISTNISSQNGTVRITEYLPLSPQVAVGLARLEQFESNFSDQNVSMNLSNLKNGTFVIQPGNITVSHGANNFYLTPLAGGESAGSVRSYALELDYPPGTDGAVWDYYAEASGSGDELALTIVLRNGYSTFSTISQVVSKSGISLLNVTDSGVLVGYVRISPPAALEVWYESNMGLKASVGLSNPAYVESNDAINITSAVNKTGRVRLA